jgi:Ser/Thr protein kinase RdoA (MazF antagonist)
LHSEEIKEAASQFGFKNDPIVEPLGSGLINQTYKITDARKDKSIVLQAINVTVFQRPQDILYNYRLVYDRLAHVNHAIHIPAPIESESGDLLWKDVQNNYWRATAYISGSYSPSIAANEGAAFTVANSFAQFTRALSSLRISDLREIIPGFHNLRFRFEKFETAVLHSPVDLLSKSTHVISELRQRKKLVDFFQLMQNNPDYPDRVMHHDCKINNILFDKETQQVICPVDLDTVMPGKFFSDLGDMIRSMACTVDEDSRDWGAIDVRPVFYQSILDGYLAGIGNSFSAEELKKIHYAGLLLIYMQSMRFITDYLEGDRYYKTQYPEQNIHRALNQLILLEKLEDFLEKQYRFIPY